MKRGSPQYVAGLNASIQRGMIAGMLFTALMGAGLYAALVATQAPKNSQITQEQVR